MPSRKRRKSASTCAEKPKMLAPGTVNQHIRQARVIFQVAVDDDLILRTLLQGSNRRPTLRRTGIMSLRVSFTSLWRRPMQLGG